MTNSPKDKQNITVSEEFEITYPRKRKGFFVDRKEWERLKRMINNSIASTNWYERIIGFCFGAFLSFIGFALTLPQYSAAFYVAAVFSLILLIVFIFFDSRERKFSSYNKDQILEYANEIEIKEIETEGTTIATPTYSRTLHAWTAINKPENEQGVDYKEISIEGKLLKTLTFKIGSDSEYWRAGFKLVTPNAPDSIPKLLTDKSFLFHIGRNEDGSYGFSIYHDGNSEGATHKTIHPENPKEISISIERNEKNFVKCFIDNSLEYNKRFNPELFKKVFLVAWGDSREYKVLFDDIAYNIE